MLVTALVCLAAAGSACLAATVSGCGGESAHLARVSTPATASSTQPSVLATTASTAASAGADPSPAGASSAGEAGGVSAGDSEAPARAGAEGGPSLSIARAVGQMLMTHVTGLTASPRLLARIRAGQVGSVILYRENINSDQQLALLTGSLQRAARAGGNPPLLIGVDQEGGSVKRLLHSPPTLSARQMGASAAPFTVAEDQGRATGLHLRRLGVNLDFAPVSDIPTSGDNFLHDRAFGYTRRAVVEGATGFAAGLAQAKVAATAKHFPGLGAAGPADTDFTTVSIAASKSRLRAAYAPYLSMAQIGPTVAPMVMISDAVYPSLDSSGLPAVLSSRILRHELALAHMGERVTITDDLEVPSVQRYSDLAVKAVSAGEDILMFAQHEVSSEAAYAAIRAAVQRHVIPSSLVRAAAARVIALKESLATG